MRFDSSIEPLRASEKLSELFPNVRAVRLLGQKVVQRSNRFPDAALQFEGSAKSQPSRRGPPVGPDRPSKDLFGVNRAPLADERIAENGERKRIVAGRPEIGARDRFRLLPLPKLIGERCLSQM